MKGEGSEGENEEEVAKIRGGERNITLVSSVTPVHHPRNSPFVLPRNPLSHSLHFTFIPLFYPRRPGAFGIRASSPPFASLCRLDAFFLRSLFPFCFFLLSFPFSPPPPLILPCCLQCFCSFSLSGLTVLHLCCFVPSCFLSLSFSLALCLRFSLFFPFSPSLCSSSSLQFPSYSHFSLRLSRSLNAVSYSPRLPISPTLPPLPYLDTVRARSPPATLEWE